MATEIWRPGSDSACVRLEQTDDPLSAF